MTIEHLISVVIVLVQVMLFVLGGAGFLFWQNRRYRKKNHALGEQVRSLKEVRADAPKRDQSAPTYLSFLKEALLATELRLDEKQEESPVASGDDFDLGGEHDQLLLMRQDFIRSEIQSIEESAGDGDLYWEIQEKGLKALLEKYLAYVGGSAQAENSANSVASSESTVSSESSEETKKLLERYEDEVTGLHKEINRVNLELDDADHKIATLEPYKAIFFDLAEKVKGIQDANMALRDQVKRLKAAGSTDKEWDVIFEGYEKESRAMGDILAQVGQGKVSDVFLRSVRALIKMKTQRPKEKVLLANKSEHSLRREINKLIEEQAKLDKAVEQINTMIEMSEDEGIKGEFAQQVGQIAAQSESICSTLRVMQESNQQQQEQLEDLMMTIDDLTSKSHSVTAKDGENKPSESGSAPVLKAQLEVLEEVLARYRTKFGDIDEFDDVSDSSVHSESDQRAENGATSEQDRAEIESLDEENAEERGVISDEEDESDGGQSDDANPPEEDSQTDHADSSGGDLDDLIRQAAEIFEQEVDLEIPAEAEENAPVPKEEASKVDADAAADAEAVADAEVPVDNDDIDALLSQVAGAAPKETKAPAPKAEGTKADAEAPVDNDDIDALLSQAVGAASKEAKAPAPKAEETKADAEAPVDNDDIDALLSQAAGAAPKEAKAPAPKAEETKADAEAPVDNDDIDALLSQAAGAAPKEAKAAPKAEEAKADAEAPVDNDDIDALLSQAAGAAPKKAKAPAPKAEEAKADAEASVDNDDIDALLSQAAGAVPKKAKAPAPKAEEAKADAEAPVDNDDIDALLSQAAGAVPKKAKAPAPKAEEPKADAEAPVDNDDIDALLSQASQSQQKSVQTEKSASPVKPEKKEEALDEEDIERLIREVSEQNQF
jgi:hypothetical protein